MGRSTPEDDFVLTISDNEDLPLSEPEFPSEAESIEPAMAVNPAKRKRNGAGAPKHKRRKTQEEDGKHGATAFLSESEEEDEEEEHRGTIDSAIDPHFQFDLGDTGVVQEIQDFDGWGDTGVAEAKQGVKKTGVDIDQIIARRAAKKAKTRPVEPEGLDPAAAASGSDHGSVDDNDRHAQERSKIYDFEDDELLQTDTFGAHATVEDEPEHSDAGEGADTSPATPDGSSDTDAVASPTAHPDDDDVDDDQSDADSHTSPSESDDETAQAAFFAPEDPAVTAPTHSASSFQQFSLSRPILRGLAALTFTTPTPIQRRAIPIALQGLDVVGSAVTGSGKTAAFLVPILERLLYRPKKVPTTRVVILMPTRELAVQCHNVATALARFTDITFALVVGGFSLREQETTLRKRPDVVIATPGRFIDHMRNTASFAVEDLEILVLDEADRMLETGFEDELNEILKTIPKGRQTMLFSATMTDSVDKLIRLGMNRPVRLAVDAKKSTTAGLVQEFIRLRPGREKLRLATLGVVCQRFFTERTIIFFRQKKEAHRVRIVFGLLGIRAGELHGSMSQEQRLAAVTAFRDGKTTHLLATDLASRGLDIKNVRTVINFEAPQTHEIYLHRVGRTARAGRSGRACTIAAEPDRKVVKAAVKAARQQGAKIVSRAMDADQVDAMHAHIEALDQEIEEILKEEKEERQLTQTEAQLARGENLVKHEAEILSRPKRTWFESEKDKRDAKMRGRLELNGPDGVAKLPKEKKKLSNKDKKRLDDRRERQQGRMWRKGKGSEGAAKRSKGQKKGSKGGRK